MKIRLLIVGKLVKNYVKDGVQEYLNMISKYTSIGLEVVKEDKITSTRPVTQILSKEGERILSKLSNRDYTVILDKSGKQLSSPTFAKFIQQRLMESYRSIVFIIGGPHGLDKLVRNRANFTLSLSQMTFAHEVCLLVFLEQLYRAQSILYGSKYHK